MKKEKFCCLFLSIVIFAVFYYGSKRANSICEEYATTDYEYKKCMGL